MRIVFGAIVTSVLACPVAAEFKPARIDVLDGKKFEPTLLVGYGYDDNLLHTGGPTESSDFLRVSPNLKLMSGTQVSHYILGYQLDSASYFDSSDDNYVDHQVDAFLHHEFTARHRIEFDYDFDLGHEARGTGILESDASITEPAEFTRHDFNGFYEFGAKSARMQIAAKFGYYDIEYDNFRNDGDVDSQFRDNDRFDFGAEINWRASQRLKWVLDVNRSEVSYDQREVVNGIEAASRDSTTLRTLVGVKWEATAKTEGRATFGWDNREFDNPSREDFDGFAWDVSLKWKPKTYSVIDFKSSSASKNPFNLQGDFIEQSRFEVSWSHQWKDRWSTKIGASFTEEDHGGIDRSDDVTQANVALRYDFRRWLRFEPYISYVDYESTEVNPDLNYDKLVYGLNTIMSL